MKKDLTYYKYLFYKTNRFKWYRDDLEDNYLKDLIKQLESAILDTIPIYRGLSKSKQFYTLYNGLGIKLANLQPIGSKEVENLIDVPTYRHFVFAASEASELLSDMKVYLAKKLNLKVFNNGKLYAETKDKLYSYIHS